MSAQTKSLSSTALADAIHARALSVCIRYRSAESELIQVLSEVDQHRVYLKRGHPSMFRYVTAELGLSENVAYALITVARKVRTVPELKASLDSGSLTLTNARRIVPLLSDKMSAADRKEWIEKASSLSARQLEKEIVKTRPEEATIEHARYVNSDRIEFKLGLSEKEMLKLRRVQDLLSQSKQRPVTLKESLEEMTALFLERKDPLKKARRHQVRKGSQAAVPAVKVNPVDATGEKRKAIPAAVVHAVDLRDERRCRHLDQDGRPCGEGRWLDYHHRIRVTDGGLSTPENLITLCSSHHKFWHLQLAKGITPQAEGQKG